MASVSELADMTGRDRKTIVKLLTKKGVPYRRDGDKNGRVYPTALALPIIAEVHDCQPLWAALKIVFGLLHDEDAVWECEPVSDEPEPSKGCRSPVFQ